ncbi:hypothetical protein [Schlesneria sp. T3-172]|uniref:hypothetical protein n=1 Tax=Schlesneria sphaerica TaxID=3373610 RepID=UPI0037C99823
MGTVASFDLQSASCRLIYRTIWQARDYGFNIWSRAKVEEKRDDRHMNPVRAGVGGTSQGLAVEFGSLAP